MSDVLEVGGPLSIAGGAMLYLPGRVAPPGDWLFNPDNEDLAAQPVQAGGRQSSWYVSGTFGRGVLRHYRRGGMVARISKDRYIWTGQWRTRSFAEFKVLVQLREHGLLVPTPLGAAYWVDGATYRAALLVERIEDAVPLALQLEVAQPDAVAQAILALHDAGAWHADLNAYNILLDGKQRVWLIDFDRARLITPTPAQRRLNLTRLRRSLIKVAGETGRAYWQRIEQAYKQQSLHR